MSEKNNNFLPLNYCTQGGEWNKKRTGESIKTNDYISFMVSFKKTLIIDPIPDPDGFSLLLLLRAALLSFRRSLSFSSWISLRKKKGKP